MNKAELIQAVREKCRDKDFASKAASERAVVAVFDVISEKLIAGEEVAIQGFGTFTTAEHGARMARNVRTGEPVEVPAKVLPKFKASQILKNAVAAAHGCDVADDAE